MSKISERRERTANTQIDNKAYLAEAPAQKKEYIYKKILIAVLAVVAVVACVLLLINAVVDAQALKDAGVISKINDGVVFMGRGEVKKNLTVKAARFTKSAAEKITAAGGKAEVI